MMSALVIAVQQLAWLRDSIKEKVELFTIFPSIITCFKLLRKGCTYTVDTFFLLALSKLQVFYLFCFLFVFNSC